MVLWVGLRVQWDSTMGEVEDVIDPGMWLDLDTDADIDERRRQRGGNK